MATPTASPITQQPDLEIQQLLAEQKTGIGGSEVYHLFNEPEFGKGCERWLGFRKLGYAEDSPEDMLKKEGIFRRGRKMEPIIAEEYELATGRKVRRQPVRRNSEYPWALVHMDRQIIAGTGYPGWVIDETAALEIKSFGEYAFREILKKGIRKGTLFQAQHTALVTGYKVVSFAGMNVGNFDLRPFDIPRDEEVIDEIKRKGDAFWNAKEKAGELGDNPFPRLENEFDVRCKTCTYSVTCRNKEADLELRTEVGSKALVHIVTNPEFAQDLIDLQTVKAEIKVNEELLDTIESKCKQTLEGLEMAAGKRLEVVEVEGVKGKWHYKDGTTSRFDHKAMQSDAAKDTALLETYNKYYKTGIPTARSLRQYGAK